MRGAQLENLFQINTERQEHKRRWQQVSRGYKIKLRNVMVHDLEKCQQRRQK